MHYLKKILDLLTLHERRRACLLLCMILMMAILDMIGVASIMPFIAVLANPQLVQTNTFLYAAYTKFGFSDTQQFLFALGILVFVILVVSLAFKALTTYAQLRFTLMREFSIGKRLVEGYLHQPYSWFLSRNSADLEKNILSETEKVIYQAMVPIMHLIAQGAVAIALLALLIIVDYKLALIVGFTLAVAYTLIFKATGGYLNDIGRERLKANQERFNAVNEAFSAYKEIKIGGFERIYTQRFASPAQTFALHQATAQVISQVPRFALEAIAFGGMLLVVLYLMAQSGSVESALPIIALYAFAGYRLMPALQQIYASVTQLRFASPALMALHAELTSLDPTYSKLCQDTIPLKDAITLRNIQYCYPNSNRQALKNLSLTIPAKKTVGLVGMTGSGKTSTVDLIIGILDPQEGTLSVDGQVINESNKRSWQRGIGYVPQNIYIADDTLAANIAFGLEENEIDQDAVERAARIANLHEFVEGELPQKYRTKLGERGVRLSGGQRQRIGIARALYHNRQVLILDEATSALDNLTEQAVIDAVHNLGHKITIIMIAHRLSTVKSCDIIFLMDKGELKAQGTFEYLSQANQNFKAMVTNN